MRGFPKHLNVAQDVENVKDLFPKETAAYLQNLAEGRFIWQDAGVVAEKDVVKETTGLKVVETKTEAGVIERRKVVLVEDPGSQFFKLGLKAEEVTGFIEAIEP